MNIKKEAKPEEPHDEIKTSSFTKVETKYNWVDEMCYVPPDYKKNPLEFKKAKPLASVLSEKEFEEEEEELPVLSRIARRGKYTLEGKYTLGKLNSNKNISYDLLLDYLKTNNIKSLLKHLLKKQYISEISDCFRNSINKEINPLISKELNAKISKESRDILESMETIDFSYLEATIANSINLLKVKKDLNDLLFKLYNTSSNLKIVFFINTYEELNYIIKECVLRDISIDSEFKNISTDFITLRTRNNSFKIAVVIDELFLLNDSYHHDFGSSPIYNTFEKIIPTKNISTDLKNIENVSINGENYPKNIVEGMIECKIETLIFNLQLEKLLQETESKRIGDGNNDSLQDIKLF